MVTVREREWGEWKRAELGNRDGRRLCVVSAQCSVQVMFYRVTHLKLALGIVTRIHFLKSIRNWSFKKNVTNLC